MSSDISKTFTKDNLDAYLKELAKEFRRQNGKLMPAEIILVGGAAILVNYGFREMTADIDAIIHASSAMRDAISRVGDRFGLPKGWINTDFTKTASYSPELTLHSRFYRTFYGVLNVRIVSAEYLIAMKLRSGRKYKNDFSDIVGILAEHEKNGSPVSMEQIEKASCELYGSWAEIPEDSRCFIEGAMKGNAFRNLYNEIRNSEAEARTTLIEFDKRYPDTLGMANADEILKSLKKRHN